MLTPHVLTTGSEKDLAAKAKYQFDTDGTILYPMKLTQNGCLEMAMYAKEPTISNFKKIPTTCVYSMTLYSSAQRILKNGSTVICC